MKSKSGMHGWVYQFKPLIFAFNPCMSTEWVMVYNTSFPSKA